MIKSHYTFSKFQLVLVAAILCSFQVLAQDEIKRKYYTNKKFKKETTEKKGKYVIIETKEGDEVTFLSKKVSEDVILDKKTYCNNLPCKEWIISMEDSEGPLVIFYNDTEKGSAIEYDYINQNPVGEVPEGYKAPVFDHQGFDFKKFIAMRLRSPYDPKMKKKIITVITQFIIAPNGRLINFSILGRPQPLYDSEVQRVILSSPLWKPATVDGDPIKTYVQMGFSFRQLN